LKKGAIGFHGHRRLSGCYGRLGNVHGEMPLGFPVCSPSSPLHLQKLQPQQTSEGGCLCMVVDLFSRTLEIQHLTLPDCLIDTERIPHSWEVHVETENLCGKYSVPPGETISNYFMSNGNKHKFTKWFMCFFSCVVPTLVLRAIYCLPLKGPKRASQMVSGHKHPQQNSSCCWLLYLVPASTGFFKLSITWTWGRKN
jgi:hypothetical protein